MPFVPVVVDGRLLPEMAAILRLVAEHDLILATGDFGRGHVANRECAIAHPDFA